MTLDIGTSAVSTGHRTSCQNKTTKNRLVKHNKALNLLFYFVDVLSLLLFYCCSMEPLCSWTVMSSLRCPSLSAHLSLCDPHGSLFQTRAENKRRVNPARLPPPLTDQRPTTSVLQQARAPNFSYLCGKTRTQLDTEVKPRAQPVTGAPD